MPLKPTRPFGHIAFSKNGRVKKEMTKLSSVKEMQELDAAGVFVASFNTLRTGREISDLEQLKQNGNDFSARLGSIHLQIELTELVDRLYTFEMSEEEFNSGRHKETIQLSYGARPHRIDPDLRNEALWTTISKKLAKSYSKPVNGEFWLIIFTVAPLFLLEYVSAGIPKVSKALQLTRTRLASRGATPFSEIWFTDLQTRPVKIWPS